MRRKCRVVGIVLSAVLSAGCAAQGRQANVGASLVAPAQAADAETVIDASKYARKMSKLIISGCKELGGRARESLWMALTDTRGVKEAQVALDKVLTYYFPEMTQPENIVSVIKKGGCEISEVQEVKSEKLYTPRLYRLKARVLGLDCEGCLERAEKALKQMTGVLDLKVSKDGEAIILIDGQIMGPRTVQRILGREGFEVGIIDAARVQQK